MGQKTRIAHDLILAHQYRDRTVEPHPPDLFVMLELIGRPKHPDRASFRLANEAEQFWLLDRYVNITALGRSRTQRAPCNSLMLDRPFTIRIDADLVSTTGKLVSAANDARFGAP